MSLFLTDILYYPFDKHSTKKKLFILSFFFLLGLYLSNKGYKFFFRAEILPTTLGFYILGNVIRKSLPYALFKKKKIQIVLFILFLIQIFSSIVLPKIDIMSNTLNIFYLPITIIAIAFFLVLFIRLEIFFSKWNVFEYLALNAVVILAFHSKVFWLTDKIMQKVFITGIPLLHVLVTIFFECLIIIPVAFLFNRYFPILVGKKNFSNA